jgi:hypothetical protein
MRPTAPSGNTTRRTRPIDWSQANWRRWNKALAHVAEIVGKIAAHDVAAPAAPIDHASPGLLASNLRTVWSAPPTDARLKKRIVRTVIQEVVADIDDAAAEIVLVVH